MDSIRAEIEQLKAEVERERRIRQKAESLSRALALELTEERAGREAMERVCDGLTEAMEAEREEVERIIREVEEERKMMRVTDVLREERVRMKLTEARMLMEEKLREMEGGLSSSTVWFELGLNSKFSECRGEIVSPPKIKKEIKSGIGARYRRGSSCFGSASACSSGSIGGRKNSACKETKRQIKDQLQLILLREESDFMDMHV